MSDTIFHQILSGALPSHGVYSDDQVYAFLDIFPAAPGHTLVVPREFSAGIPDAEESTLAACMRAVRRLIPALQAATGAEGCNVVSNNGKAAGQVIEYLHFHIIPRSSGDDVVLGTPGSAADQGALAELAERVHGALM